MVRGKSGGSPPAYARIAAALRDQIERGDLGPKALLPTERELAELSGVSRMTARHAMMILESEGLVVRNSRGTVVAAPRLTMRAGSFYEELERQSVRTDAALLWAEPQDATPRICDELDLPEGSRVNALQRLRHANGEAVAVETSYYPAELTPGLLEVLPAKSLWAVMRVTYGIVPVHTTASLSVVALDEYTAKKLSARTGAPGLAVSTRSYTDSGRCFEFCRNVYRADRVAFQFDSVISSVAEPHGQEGAVR